MSTEDKKIIESLGRLTAKKGSEYVRGLLDGLEIGTADVAPPQKESVSE